MRRLVLPLTVIAGLALTSLLPSTAAARTEPAGPVVAAFDFTPKSIDVSGAAQQVTVTARLTDDTASNNPVVTITSDLSDQSSGIVALDFVGGGPQNSSWSKTITFSTSSTPGAWTVTLGNIVDVNGNPSPDVEHPAKLSITNPGVDIEPPVLESFTFTPQTVDLQAGSREVVVRAHVTDETGVSQVLAFLDSDLSSDTSGPLPMTRVSGSPQDGEWRAAYTLPPATAPGPWTVSLGTIFDDLGNAENSSPTHPTKLVVQPSGQGAVCASRRVTVFLEHGQVPTSGDDVILGTRDDDVIDGGNGNDVLCGTNGNDVLEGGPGKDVLDGGNQNDTVTYADATSAVTVTLKSSAPQNTGSSTGTDTLRHIENASGGPKGDTLIGNRGDNRLEGRAGNDSLNGKEGADTLIGGKGRDYCLGGAGTDSAPKCERRKQVPRVSPF